MGLPIGCPLVFWTQTYLKATVVVLRCWYAARMFTREGPMITNRGSKSDRALTVAIIVVVAATIGMTSWLVYFALIRPHIASPELPANVVDLRGRPAPEVHGLTAVHGGDLAAELRREKVVIAFLLTTCPACNRAWPVLDDLWGGGELGVVGIFAESEAAIEGYATRFPRFTDPSRSAFDAFEALTLPAIYTLRDGRVEGQTVGWSPSIERTLRTFAKGGE